MGEILTAKFRVKVKRSFFKLRKFTFFHGTIFLFLLVSKFIRIISNFRKTAMKEIIKTKCSVSIFYLK